MTQWQQHMEESAEEFPESSFDSGKETLNNEERGCGHLETGKGYLRSDLAGGEGSIPPVVEVPEPIRIPFKEGHFRTWKNFPGLQFELALNERAAELDPKESSAMEYVSALSKGGYNDGELWNHLKRLAGSAHPLDAGEGGSDHIGTMRVAQAHDIIMWVGETYYPEPEDFVAETKARGLNKAISMSKRNPPPVVNPGKTRLWLIHPKGIENYPEKDSEELDEMGIAEEDRHTSAVIGYCYLTRCIYTEDADGRIPDYIGRWETAGDLDVVEVGREISFEEMENESLEEMAAKANGDSEEAESE